MSVPVLAIALVAMSGLTLSLAIVVLRLLKRLDFYAAREVSLKLQLARVRDSLDAARDGGMGDE